MQCYVVVLCNLSFFLFWVLMSTELLIFFYLCVKMHTIVFFSFLGLEDRGQKKKFCSLQDIISAWYSHLH